MAIEFVRCRRVDDPTKVADLAVSALQHLPGWERVPEEELRAAREAERAERLARVSEAAQVEVTKQPPAPPEPPRTGPDPAQDKGDGETPARSTSRKSRSRAADEK